VDTFGNGIGSRAVRWDASSTAATELGNLVTKNVIKSSSARAINDAGTIVGGVEKYDASVNYLGSSAVRWDASGTATELGNLGTHTGIPYTSPVAINDSGTAVGWAIKYDASGTYLGGRAVRWDASDTTAIELGNLGGSDVSDAYAINNSGIIVGHAYKYGTSGNGQDGDRAVYWGADNVAVDLNTLIDPASGWTLNYADCISDTGWIAGVGSFDPDGAGGQDAYERLFLLQIPEPSSFVLLAGASLAYWFIRRRHR
jgi:uncharacterized membrane protein